MSEPIFEEMNIDISKIRFYMSIDCNKYLPEASGRATQICYPYDNILNFGNFIIIRSKFFIQIRNDLQFDEFIQAYAHEVGHVTQKCGYSEKRIIEIFAEAIALKFEKSFLNKFNKKYNTNIPIKTAFKKLKNKIANYFKNYMILITKSEYKLTKK